MKCGRKKPGTRMECDLPVNHRGDHQITLTWTNINEDQNRGPGGDGFINTRKPHPWD